MKVANVNIGKTQWVTAGLGVVLVVVLFIAINRFKKVEDAARKVGMVR